MRSLSPLYTGTINISGMVEFCLLEEIPSSACGEPRYLPHCRLHLCFSPSFAVWFSSSVTPLPHHLSPVALLLFSPAVAPLSLKKTFWEIPRWFWLYRHGSTSLKALKAVALDHHCLQKLIDVPFGWKMHSGVWFVCIQLTHVAN